MNAPEAYIQFTPGLINDDGEVTDETTEQFLRDFMEQFEQFMERVSRYFRGCPGLDELSHESRLPPGYREQPEQFRLPRRGHDAPAAVARSAQDGGGRQRRA